MKQNKVMQMISLANKAGKIKSGQVAVESAVKSMKAYLVIVAKDASDATKDDYRNMCSHYDVEYLEYSDKVSLGNYIGKEHRAAVCVCDENFASSISGLANA